MFKLRYRDRVRYKVRVKIKYNICSMTFLNLGQTKNGLNDGSSKPISLINSNNLFNA